MIKRLGCKLINTAKKVGLTVNEDRTEYLVASRIYSNNRQEQFIKIEEHMFKRMVQFKYLGLIKSKDNDVKTKIPSRIQQSNKGYCGLEKVLKSKALSINL